MNNLILISNKNLYAHMTHKNKVIFNIFIFILVSLNSSLALSTCTDSDQGEKPLNLGFITYTLDQNCDKKNINQINCHALYQKDYDLCLDQTTLLERVCQNGLPQDKKIKCPPQTKCHKGKCH